MPAQRIVGQGIAANACARLLVRAGIGVSLEPAPAPRVPALLIGAATQALIEDVFPIDENAGEACAGSHDVASDDTAPVARTARQFFSKAAPVKTRYVAWGDGAEPVAMPHSAVVLSEADLASRLQPALSSTGQDFEWTIHASKFTSDTLSFGSRVATASRVRLQPSADREACWIESLDCGWLFLLPGWLLAVGATADELLSASRLIARQIESRESPSGTFPAYARVADPICGIADPMRGDRWMACGSAAMALDPICGDGTGAAIREAILASAVIRAARRGEDSAGLLKHYRARLLSGFLRHLELSIPFYQACRGDWWRGELAMLEQGMAWTRAQLQDAGAFRYRLRDFELELIDSAAQTPA